MSQSSVLQPLGGPLAGRALEFPGHDVVLGSAPDCEVRIDVAGVHPYHARIVINETGATLFGIEGVVGINDDKVLGEGRLNNGDFVWIGEPGADGALMFQFTLGSPAIDEPQVVEDLDGFEVQESIEDVEIGEPTPDLDLVDIEPEPAAEPFFAAALPDPDPYPEPEPAPPPALPAPKTLSSSGAFKPPAPWQSAALPEEPPAAVEYASAWDSKPAPAEPIEEVHEELEAPEPEPPTPPPPPPAPASPKRQITSPNPRPKVKAAPEIDLAALVPPHPQRPERTTSSTGVVVGGLITLILLGIGISWVVNTTPPVDEPPSVPGSVVMPTRPPATALPPAAPPTATGLLQEAATVLAAGDVAKAGQLLSQAAQLDPANAEVAARKAEIDARLVILARMFSPGATTLVGARPARGADPAAKADLAAQIRCGVTPASVEPGVPYTVRCSIVNVGQKPFRIESVGGAEVCRRRAPRIRGHRAAAGAGAPGGGDGAREGGRLVGAVASGLWTLTAKTTKAESFVVSHSWR
jgi:hypothetical protein